MVSSQSKIMIVEFGGQYTHLISRRIRDLGVFAELVPYYEVSESSLDGVVGIVLSGGPRSVGLDDNYPLPESLKKILDSSVLPVLGICYGHQLLADYFGGVVRHSESREYGPTEVRVIRKGGLLRNEGKLRVWMSHSDYVSEVAEGFEVLASSETCPVVAMEDSQRGVFGVQFHPEVTHTEQGFEILRYFVQDICAANAHSWSMKAYKDELIAEMREEIGDERVLLGVSGGVDSTVASLVLKQAVGSQLHLVFVNHGLLRKDEEQQVIHSMEEEMGFENFHYVDATDQFLSRLEGVTEPEEKRKIIGFTFIDVFEQKARDLELKYGRFKYLGQGTIYSDRVESGAAGAGTSKIKSHHNLTLPEKMELQVIEPLKELYKDEVRELGMVLGAPESLVKRYPFPGPGLAVRILGSVDADRLHILKEADAIFLEELYRSKVHEDIWQAFAVLLPVRAVGVQGDNRAYGQVIALRSVSSTDGMTADFSRIPYELLSRISTRIINEISDITRVVYDISPKPPSTIEWE